MRYTAGSHTHCNICWGFLCVRVCFLFFWGSTKNEFLETGHRYHLQLYQRKCQKICNPQKTQEAIFVLIQTQTGSLSNVTYPFSLLSPTFPCTVINRTQKRECPVQGLYWINFLKVGLFLNLQCNQSPNSSQLDKKTLSSLWVQRLCSLFISHDKMYSLSFQTRGMVYSCRSVEVNLTQNKLKQNLALESKKT